MRIGVLFIFFVVTRAVAQSTIVPEFDSELVKSIYIDENLVGTPSEYYIKSYFYNKDSAKLIPASTINNYYLENGKVLAMEVTKDGKPFQFYQLDSEGRIIEFNEMSNNSNTPRIVFTNDDITLTASETVYRRNQTIHSKTIIRYNSQLKVIAREEYSGETDLSRFWKYEYNTNQDLVTDQYFDRPSSLNAIGSTGIPGDATYYTYEYNSNQRKAKRLAYQNEVLKSRRHYEYYPDSSVTTTTFYQFNGVPNEQHITIEKDSLRIELSGFLNQFDTTKFRSRFMEVYLEGDLIEYERRTLSGTYVDRFATFYESDELGNWIKKITYSNGIIIKQEERTILY